MSENNLFKAEKVESFEDLKNLYKKKPWMLVLHIIVITVLAIAINSCTGPSDIEKLSQEYSNEKWAQVANDKFKKHTIFEENGRKHITVDVGDYGTFNIYGSNVEESLEVIGLNQELDGDAIIVATKNFVDKYGKTFERNVIMATFPLSETRKVNFDQLEGTRLVFAHASKIVIMSPDIKQEIAEKCLKRGWVRSMPLLCKATRR